MTKLPSVQFPSTLDHVAQQIDEWPGEDYEETSLQAGEGCKRCENVKWTIPAQQ
ncbi:MAG TPA: hypothetical protein VES88_05095 [Gemmatimonadaceae bacterium]|nr:hypothetical protein [Gemmatimonadaceae bacterium]